MYLGGRMTDLFSPLAQDRWFGISLMTYDFLFCTNLIGKVNDFVLDMQEICKKRDANVVFCISFCSFCKRSSLSLE